MDNKIVVSDGSAHGLRRWFSLRNIAAALIVVAVALAAGGILRWVQQLNKPKAPAAPPASAPAHSAQVTALYGRPEDALKQINEALKKTGLSASDKYSLYYQQGAIYQNMGNNASALESYKKAAAAQPSQRIYEALGDLSQQLGDNASAISYYKKALVLIPANAPFSKEDKAADEQKIRDLGGQP